MSILAGDFLLFPYFCLNEKEASCEKSHFVLSFVDAKYPEIKVKLALKLTKSDSDAFMFCVGGSFLVIKLIQSQVRYHQKKEIINFFLKSNYYFTSS